ncbi:hypothetical protein ACTJJB_01690 [Chitinophaga sp. 22536]|uniref:hypothetical protein n=1 Tax=unclassified Chitinophaga TaxID=2619133 RepID=UPI003F866C35
MKASIQLRFWYTISIINATAWVGMAIYHQEINYAFFAFLLPAAVRSLFFLTFKK